MLRPTLPSLAVNIHTKYYLGSNTSLNPVVFRRLAGWPTARLALRQEYPWLKKLPRRRTCM